MKLFNSLSKKIENLDLNPEVSIYTCGPTVYSYVSIGNWRTYTLSDLVIRTLKFSGYQVKFVMNLTDVGHLTGDNLGDSSSGDDRLEKAAKKEGKNAYEIAEFYTENFLKNFEKLRLTNPIIFCKATEHLPQQIKMVENIVQKGFTYQTTDGIYFDVAKYEESGYKYGKLSNLDQIKEGARVEVNLEKKDARDFALWKFSKPEEKRHMEWPSPWGTGFPGWHIECSAMSIEYLGETIDIHIGGEDLRSTHHPNEIAQSEIATGKEFVKYWLHGAFLQVNGGKMGKSLGNAYTLEDIEEKGFSAFDLKFFYYTTSYRKPQNFTWELLENAKKLMDKIRFALTDLAILNHKDTNIDTIFLERFKTAVTDDLNMPLAVSVIWDLLKSNLPTETKIGTILKFDEVLGLDLSLYCKITEEAKVLIAQWKNLKSAKEWEKSDLLRKLLKEKFYIQIKD